MSVGYKPRQFLTLVGLPLLVAGGIYVLFRDNSLLLFDGLKQLQITPMVSQLRDATAPIGHRLPTWVKFSLPDGLWLLSYLFFLRLVWAESPRKPMWLWVSLGLLVSVGHELGQAAGFMHGTFDWVDLAAYTTAAVTALAIRLPEAS